MGCGQKKQNTETGVHLTERTCSPYNPIIKQIVDDCLGLPIYPVTSVDAVIDEEGNTLRKLLEDGIGVNSEELINYIDSKLQEVSETYVTSNQFTTLVNQTLPNTYARKSLETLVWAISALSNIRVDNEDDLYDDDNKTPKIVKAVTQLQSQMQSILGQGSGDTPSLGQLSATVNLLKEVLIAVASFNEGYNPNGKLELEGNQLQIIKEILEIKTDISNIEDDISRIETNIGDLSDDDYDISGNIIQRINYINNNLEVLRELVSTEIQNLKDIIGVRQKSPTIAKDIKDIKETLIKKADLDPVLSAQKPEGFNDSNNDTYRKLKASEYPVTSIYIFGSEVKDFLTDLSYPINHMFVYFPKGTKFGAKCGGGVLNYDFNEDGVVNWRDVATYIDFKSKYNGTNFESAVSQVECSSTFTEDESYWNVDGDESIGTLGDLNALTDLVLKGTGFTYLEDHSPVQSGNMTSLELSNAGSASIFEITRNTPTGGEYPTYSAPSDNVVKNVYMGINEYSPNEDDGKEYFKVIRHPAIEGKLYYDLGTNTLYRYKGMPNSAGAMINLNEEDIVCQYLGSRSSTRNFYPGQNVVTSKCHQVFAKPAATVEAGTSISSLKYSVLDVTDLINFLLGATGTTNSIAKSNVQASEIFDLQNIKNKLINSEENISDSVNLDTYDFEQSWEAAQSSAAKTQVIVNAIRAALKEYNISNNDLSISDIKAALSGNSFPHSNFQPQPKPTTIPDNGQTLGPAILHGSSDSWKNNCYVKNGTTVAIENIPNGGQIYNEMIIAKYDITGDHKVSIEDVTSLINILLGSDVSVRINPVYYDYAVGVITDKREDQNSYIYEVEELQLKPGKRVFLLDPEAELISENDAIYKYKRAYIDYDGHLQPDLDDYNLGQTVTGWTLLEHNGFIKDVIQTPIFLDQTTNKIGLIQGNKTIYFTINGNTADITVTDTQYNYGGEMY